MLITVIPTVPDFGHEASEGPYIYYMCTGVELNRGLSALSGDNAGAVGREWLED